MAEPRAHAGPRGFIAGLGVAQIVSWGTLYYAFPLLADPTAAAIGVSKVEVYGAASIGLASGGLAAYGVGRLVDGGRGRALMTAGAVLGGLMLFAWSQLRSPALLVPLFVGLGIAQAMSLYEPAFALIARRRGADARNGITQLTLWGGFASTVFIPVTQALLELLSWRETLLVLGGVQLALAAPLNWLVAGADGAPSASVPRPQSASAFGWAIGQPVFWALALAFTLYYGAFSALALHLYPLLTERGIGAAEVVLVLAIIGPAQVAGRVLLWKLGPHVPVRIAGSATIALLLLGLVLLRLAGDRTAVLLAFGLVYGGANGVMTIVRGLAVPEMLTREHYGAINGLLAAPALLAKAAAPVAAAWLWATGGYGLVLDCLIAATVVVMAALAYAGWLSARRRDLLLLRPRQTLTPHPISTLEVHHGNSR